MLLIFKLSYVGLPQITREVATLTDKSGNTSINVYKFAHDAVLQV